MTAILTFDLERRPATAFVKRSIDICVAAAGLLALAPVFALLSGAIRISDGGPAFFRQARVGRHGVSFQILKFRSMRHRSGRGSELTVAGDERITRIGAIIRRYKVDEIPQLWNVLVGEMSLIGPRPETPGLMTFYTPEQRLQLTSVRPGITDWASLLLRNESELLAGAADPAAFYRDVLMPLKFDLNLCYCRDSGVRTDMRILAATLWALVAPRFRNPCLTESVRARFQRASEYLGRNESRIDV